jgi:hypothetical protein
LTGCPRTLPEARNLVLWLVGDNYGAAAGAWRDLSGHGADALCSGSACAASAIWNGHGVVSFDGATSYFSLSDPKSQYATQKLTVIVVANPASPTVSAPADAQLLLFADGAGDSIGLGRSGSTSDLTFQLLPGAMANSLVATGAWTNAWERIIAAIDPAGASLAVGEASPVSGSIGTPAAVDYASSTLGTDSSKSLFYGGAIAELLVFDTTSLSATSLTNLESYLYARYPTLP